MKTINNSKLEIIKGGDECWVGVLAGSAVGAFRGMLYGGLPGMAVGAAAGGVGSYVLGCVIGGEL